MHAAPHTRRRSTWISSATSGLITGIVVFGVVALSGIVVAAPAQADDSSAVTVTAAAQDPDAANAPFPELKLTVSQTTGLVSQGIVLSWTGGKASKAPSSQIGGADFLQFAQCWGDDPSDPTQPDRTTCQYGAFLSAGATRDGSRSEDSAATEDAAYTVPSAGSLSPAYTAIPFRSATGVTVASVVDSERVSPPVDVNTNEFFTALTSNEVSWAGSGADGTGSTKMELQTVVQSPGLGCGERVEAADGTVTGKPCWLVAIPRGTADVGEGAITQSGLFWDAWKHKLAVKLDFRPVGINCAIGSAERQLAGSELLAGAVASWQPKLCGAEGGDAYTIITGSESDAAAGANGTIPAPLALTSRPLSTEGTDDLVYAPVGLTGVALSFAIDRSPKADSSVPPEAAARTRLPFTSMKLTPRLVAKLLTASYLDALPYQADRSHLSHTVKGAVVKNPRTLLQDPDFLAINDPEWAYQAIVSPAIADALVPQGRSDAAWQLWSYVMADPDAVAFLEGEADPWNMIVNKWSATDAAVNGSGSALTLPRDNFPKADPAEQPAETDGPGAINLVTWRPYTNDLDTVGYLTLRGDGQILGGWDPQSIPAKYTKSTRSLPGAQSVIGVTDLAAAAKYQVVTASLRNPAGKFVAPTVQTMTAAAAAMTVTASQSQVYGLDFASKQAIGATSAYPLTMPVYAALNPAMKDDELRASYGTFITYAVTDGQTPGAQIGELPAGYAPLPDGWRTQALAAAALIVAGAPAPTPSPSAPAPAVAPAAPVSGSGYGSSSGGSLAPAAAGASTPLPSGAAAGALSGAVTPDDPAIGGVQAAFPASVLGGIAGAVAVPLIPRLRRRL